jgi:hypothetical protein
MAQLWNWEKGIISLPSLELRPDTGGYITAKWGSLVLIPDLFGGVPKQKCEVKLDYGQAYYVSIPLFSGTILLKTYTREQLEYEIYQPEITVKLLDEGTDHEGKTVPIPLVIGTVNHMRPQRTGTDVEWKFYKPDFAGAIGTDWHLYDDGVSIDTQWTDNLDGTISRSVGIVGELTASGVGNMTDIHDLFVYGAERLDADLVSPHDADIELDHCFATNEYITDILGKVCYYAGYRFYFGKDFETGDRTMTLIAADDQNGESELTQYEYQTVTYTYPDRIKTLSCEITSYTPEEVKTTLSVDGDFQMAGQENTLSDVFSTDHEKVLTQLNWHLAYLQMPVVEIKMPFVRMPQHGEKITFSDYRKPGVKVDAGVFFIEEISLSPKERIMTLKGRGDVLFENA